MKRSALVLLVLMAAVGAGAVSSCGSGDGQASERTLEDVYRDSWGAYNCMPADVRRRFDRVYPVFAAHQKKLIARLSAEDRRKGTLPADRKLDRLQRRVSRLIAPYYPRGRRFDRACYERAQESYAGRPLPRSISR
jgi:hypothetical protein